MTTHALRTVTLSVALALAGCDAAPSPDAGADAGSDRMDAAPPPDAWLDPTRDAGREPPDAGRDAAIPSPGSIRGLWLWDSAARLLASETERDAFLDFAEAPHGRADAAIDRVFFEARDYDKSTTPFTVRTDYLDGDARDALRAFVRAASARGIRVDYLDGQAEWARTENRDVPIAIAEAVLAYDAAVGADERLGGIHLDIEPHQLGAEWRVGGADCCTGARPDCYSDELQENVVYIATEIRRRIDASGLDVELTFDIGTDYAICAPDLVVPLAAAGPDHLTIMNYFDDLTRYLDGEDGFGGVRQNLAYVPTVPLLFGVETICPPHAPDPMTFCEEGEPALEGLLDAVEDDFGGDRRFLGVAVHHHDSYVDL